MNILPTYKIKLSQLLLVVFAIALLTSCEVKDEPVVMYKLDFDIEEVVKVGEELDLHVQTPEGIESVEWVISDGTVYNTESATHLFTKPGKYLVSLYAFKNNQQVVSQEKTIEVLGNQKLITLDDYRSVREAIFTEGRIVLNTVNKQNEVSFLLISDQLELIKEVYGASGINSELEMSFSMGDSILAFSEQASTEYTFLKYKSSSEENFVSAGIINYNNGLLVTQTNSSNQLSVAYFNASSEKLWSRNFASLAQNGSEHIFSLNSRLYYLNFSSTEDAVYIEKFNNPSVIFNKQNHSFCNESKAREVIFVSKNHVNNTIDFALYNTEEDITTIYSLNESCDLTTVKEVSGRFDISSQKTSPVGNIAACASKEVVKYSKNWDILATYKVESSSFGICQLGANLILVYENLPSGNISLSYLDKNLQPVYFD